MIESTLTALLPVQTTMPELQIQLLMVVRLSYPIVFNPESQTEGFLFDTLKGTRALLQITLHALFMSSIDSQI